MKISKLLYSVAFLTLTSAGCASSDRSSGASGPTRTWSSAGSFQEFIATQGKVVALPPGSKALAAKTTSIEVFDDFRKWCKGKNGIAGTAGAGMFPSWFCKGGNVENGLVGVTTQGVDYFADPPRLTVHFYSAANIDPALVNAMVTEGQLAARRVSENAAREKRAPKEAAQQELMKAERIEQKRQNDEIARAQVTQKAQAELEAVRVSGTRFWNSAARGDKTCLVFHPAKFETNDLGGGVVFNLGVATYVGSTVVSAYVEEVAGDNVKLTLSEFKFVGKLAHVAGEPDREFRPDHIATPEGTWRANSVIWQQKKNWGRCLA